MKAELLHPIKNSFAEHPVYLIFKKILKDRLSGELVVMCSTFEKKFFFVKGLLEFATTTIIDERLGELLLSIGRISESDLTKLSKIKANTTRKTGNILHHITNLTQHDLYYALIFQLKTIAITSFSITTGEWKFTPKNLMLQDDQQFHIKLEEIIIEGTRKIEDFSYFRKRYFFRCPVTTSIPEPVGKFLSSDEIKFYIRLASQPNISCEQILEKQKIPEDVFWRNIALFYLLNIVDFVEYTIDSEVNKSIEEINELYEKVKDSHYDFYDLFGLKENSPSEDIREIYYTYSRKYHPDRIHVAPDSPIKTKANTVFAEINRAYETLISQEKRLEYDSKRRAHPFHQEQPEVQVERKHKALYLRANALYKQKKYWEAAALLEEAIRFETTKSAYFLLLGLCYTKSEATRKLAEKNFKIVADLEPWNADPYFALGELHRMENNLKKAKHYFEKALEINMEHTLANRALKETDAILLSQNKKPLFSLFGKKKND